MTTHDLILALRAATPAELQEVNRLLKRGIPAKAIAHPKDWTDEDQARWAGTDRGPEITKDPGRGRRHLNTGE